MSDRTRKLVSIRHHTDHDLQVLVSRELDRGFALMHVATTRTSSLFAQAVKSYDTARTILPRIADLSEGDRLQIESRLKGLRVRLDQVPTFEKAEPYPMACVVAPRATMFSAMVSQFGASANSP